MLKQYKPITPGLRGLVRVDKEGLWKGSPHKPLTTANHEKAGRNSNGRITMRRRGGRHKRSYRIVDFCRSKLDVIATVERIEYDPNRTAYIALIKYDDAEFAYIIAPQKLSVGDKIVASESADIKIGNAMLLKNIPVGTIVHNVEMKPKKGAQLARSAGAYVQIVGRDGAYIQVKLPSGEQRLIHANCFATIGSVSNQDHSNTTLGKAGRARWLGKRPQVRGVAMNPIDHPHGGGEGRTSGGRHPVTPWGVPTKGKKTRNKKNPSSSYIIKRRKK